MHFEIESVKVKIFNLIKNEKNKIEYDFGDSWKCDIILEKKIPYDNNCTYTVCIKGKMNTPPGDCGGVWGYD